MTLFLPPKHTELELNPLPRAQDWRDMVKGPQNSEQKAEAGA